MCDACERGIDELRIKSSRPISPRARGACVGKRDGTLRDARVARSDTVHVESSARSVELMLGSPAELVRSMHAAECRSFYARVDNYAVATASLQAAVDAPGPSRAAWRWMATREVRGCHPPQVSESKATSASLVVLVPELRIAYIENRKAASTVIRQLLRVAFNASYFSCGDNPVPPRCSFTEPLGMRCTSKCLSIADVAEYFFFSFVRHPVERFFSALTTYMQVHKKTPHSSHLMGGIMRSEDSVARDLLARLSSCFGDMHTASQTFQLNAAISNNGTQRAVLPVDFLGSVDRFHEHFMLLLRAANGSNTYARGRLTAAHLARAETALAGGYSRHSSNTSGNKYGAFYNRLHALRNETVDHAVANAYAQDMLCLGATRLRRGKLGCS